MLRVVVGKPTEVSESALACVDYDDSGSVGIADVISMLKVVVGKLGPAPHLLHQPPPSPPPPLPRIPPSPPPLDGAAVTVAYDTFSAHAPSNGTAHFARFHFSRELAAIQASFSAHGLPLQWTDQPTEADVAGPHSNFSRAFDSLFLAGSVAGVVGASSAQNARIAFAVVPNSDGTHAGFTELLLQTDVPPPEAVTLSAIVLGDRHGAALPTQDPQTLSI